MPYIGGLITVPSALIYAASQSNTYTQVWAAQVCRAVEGACNHPQWLIVAAMIGIGIGLLELSFRARV